MTIKTLKRLMLSLTAFVFVGLLVPATSFAVDPFKDACSTTTAKQSAVCQGKGDPTINPLAGPNSLFHGISAILALVTGIIAVIVLIIGGFRYITSGGDPAKAKAARDSIIYALVGVAVVALAGTIISFVLSRIQ